MNMKMIEEIKLKPCPYCGLDVQHYQEWLNRATSWLCGSSQLLSTTPVLKEIYSHLYPIREWFKKEEDDNN